MESAYKNIKPSNEISWTHFFRQLLVALLLWTSYINTGIGMGTPTVAVPQFRAEANSTDAVSLEMSSWLTSGFGISGSVCLFFTVPMAHFFGRKLIMIILPISAFISSLLLYLSKSAMHLLISQIILGLTNSAQSSVYLLILTEYSSPKYRGVFLTIKSATFFWGVWIANAVGIFTNFRYSGIIGMCCAAYSIFIGFIIPESPYWLASKERYEECAVAHRWLKGTSKDSENELAVMITSQKEKIENEQSDISLLNQIKTHITALKQPDIYKPMLLAFTVISIYNFSGKFVCAVYSIEMLKKLSRNKATVTYAVLILDAVSVFGMYVGCGLSKIFKRRTLFLTTTATGVMFLFLMSFYLYLAKLSVFEKNDYVMVSMLVIYSLAVSTGPMILSSSIAAELLPLKFRSYCNFILSLFILITLSSIVKISPYVFTAFGFEGAYLGFGICSIVFLLLAYKYLPETKDRSLHEIAEFFKPKEKDAAQCKLLNSAEVNN